MKFAEHFAHAVTSLPDAAMRRMDGDAPLDWKTLGDPGTGVEIDGAVRGGRRLPEPVETLAAKLINEVGIFPLDLAAGADRERAANAWLRRIAIDPDGERYRLRNRRSGEIHARIRPEAVAGYVVLALELATAVHEATGLWIEAGEGYAETGDEGLASLARCAIRMSVRLKAAAEPGSGRGSTGKLGGILEDIWNAQGLAIREELCGAIRPDAATGAYAPRRRHYAPAESYRVHAFDLGEIRWLCALGERARDEARAGQGTNATSWLAPRSEPETTGDDADESASESEWQRAEHAGSPAAVSTVELSSDPDELALGRELAELQRTVGLLPPSPGPGSVPPTLAAADSEDEVASLELTALEARVQAEAGNSLAFGSGSDGTAAEDDLAAIRHAVARLPGAVRRRLGDAHGIGVAQALARLRDPAEADAAFGELRSAIAAQRAPAWLEELASSLLADAGARTRDGARTGSLSLDLTEGPGVYLAAETQTGLQGQMTLPAILEQLHLALTFAEHAWTGLETIRTAGVEAGWALGESPNGASGIDATEHEMLEAARLIGSALGRSRHAARPSNRPPSALDQAAMAAEAIGAVGPTVRAAAGWPGAAEAPDPRDPGDIARVAAFADALHESVKSISNRTIAGRMTTTSAAESMSTHADA